MPSSIDNEIVRFDADISGFLSGAKAMASAVEKLKTSLSFSDVNEKIGAAANIVTGQISQIAATGNAAASSVAGNVSAAVSSVISSTGTLSSVFSGQIGEIVSAVNQASAEIATTVEQTASQVAASITGVTAQIADIAGEASSIANAAAAAVTASAEAAHVGISSKLAGILKALGVTAAGAAVIVTGILIVSEQAREKLRNVIDGVKAMMQSAADYISNSWETLKNRIAAAVNAIRETVLNAFTAIKTFTAEHMPTLYRMIAATLNAIKNAVQSLWQGISQIVQNITDTIKAKINAMSDDLKKSVSEMTENIKEKLRSIPDAFSRAKEGIASKFHRGSKDGLTEAFDETKAAAEAAGSKGAQAMADIASAAERAEAPVADLAETLENAVPTDATAVETVTEVGDAAEEAAGDAETLAKALEGAGHTDVSQPADEIQNAGDAAEEAAEKTEKLHSVFDRFGGIGEKLKGALGPIGEKLGESFGSIGGKLKDAVKNSKAFGTVAKGALAAVVPIGMKFAGTLKEHMSASKESAASMEQFGGAVEGVKNKFSVLEQIGVGALRNIGAKASDALVRFAKGVSVDQVEAGWHKYADKTSSVQTIMSATAQDFEDTGTQMEYVNGQLEKLNWFTDETSYNFLDMVNNIGKFTSNGVKLDTAVTAMEGIGTWGATAGANVGEISRAMYNLSQAVSTGSVKLIDWKSIENANMATLEFKETAIETAVSLGKLRKAGDKTYKTLAGHEVSATNFNENLKDEWFTSEVLLSTLKKYGDFSGKLNEVTTITNMTATELLGALDEYEAGTLDLTDIAKDSGASVEELDGYFKTLTSDTMALGRKAFKAAQEAKTFQEAIAATKDAVSTGFMNIFEKIFGNYEQAKVLWTWFANELYDIFAEPLNAVNDLLDGWSKLGGREALLEGVQTAWNNIKSAISAVKDGFHAIFPSLTGERLAEMTEKFRDFVNLFKPTEKHLATLKTIGGEIGKIFSSVKEAGSAIGESLRPMLEGSSKMMEAISGALAPKAAKTVGELNDLLGHAGDKKLRNSMAQAMDDIAQSAEKAGEKVELLGHAGDKKLRNSMAQAMDDIAQSAEKAGEKVELLGHAGDKKVRGSVLTPAAGEEGSAISGFVQTAVKGLMGAAEKLRDLLRNQIFGTIKAHAPDIAAFVTGLLDLGKAIASIVKNLSGGAITGAGSLISKILGLVLKLAGWVGKLASAVAKLISENRVVQGLFDLFKKGAANIKAFFNAFRAGENGNKISFLDRLGEAAKKLKEILEPVTGQIKKFFDTLGSSMQNAADSGGSGLATGGGILGGIILLAGKLLSLFTKIQSAKNLSKTAGIIKDAGGGIASVLKPLADGLKTLAASVKIESIKKIAGALLMLAGAVFILSITDPGKLAVSLLAIITLVAALSGSMILLSRKVTDGDLGGISDAMLKLSGAVLILSFAIAILGRMNTMALVKGIAAIGAILIFFGIFAKVMAKLQTTVSEGATAVNAIGDIGGALLKLAASMAIVAIALKIMGTMDLKEMGIALLGFISTLAAMTAALILISRLSKGNKAMATAAASILAISFAMTLVSGALKIMGTMDLKEMGIALLGFISTLAAMAAALILISRLSKGNKAMATAAASILAISFAMILVSGALKIMGTMDLKEMGIALLGFISTLAAMTAALILISRLSKGNKAMATAAASILAISFAMTLVSGALQRIAGIGFDKLLTSVVALAAMLFAISAALLALQNNESAGKMLAAAGAIFIVSLSAIALAAALKKLSKLSLKDIVVSVTALSASLLAIVALGALAAYSGATLGLLALAACIAAIGIAAPLVAKAIPALVAGLMDLLKAIQTALPIIVAIVVSFIARLLAAIRILIPAIVGVILDIIGAVLVAIETRIGAIVAVVASILVKILIELARWLPVIIDAAIVLMVGFVEGLAYGIEANSERIFAAISHLLGAIINLVLSGIQSVIGMFGPVGRSLAEKIDGVKDKVHEAFSGEFFNSEGKSAGEQAANGLNAAKSKFGENGKLSIKEYLGGILDGASAAKETGKSAAEDAAGGLSAAGGLFNGAGLDSIASYMSGLFGGVGDASEAGVTAAGSALEGIDSKDDAFSFSGETAINNFVGALSNGKQPAKTEGARVAGNGAAGADSKKRDFEIAGENAGQGFINGVAAKYIPANTAGKTLADRFLSGLTGANGMDEHSPSKKTFKDGAFAVEGLIGGVKSLLGKAETTGELLGEKTADGIAYALNSIADVIEGEYDGSFTITPVLDLTDLRNGAGQIGSILNMGKSYSLDGIAQARYAPDIFASPKQSKQTIQVNNGDVVSEIKRLRSDINTMSERIDGMQVTLDGRKLVGAISRPMDKRLGQMAAHSRKG